MKKTQLLIASLMLCLLAYSTQSCKKADEEFVADNSTFSGYMNWSKDATFNGADPSLGPAHGGNDSTTTRDVYFKDGQAPENDAYPIGTVIVKHSHNTSGSVAEYTAMVKRGNGYNASSGDWEWFMLESNGNIATDSTGMERRGGDLMNGACTGCHLKATTDYVFSK